jgi:hypothetical protein
MPRYRVPLPLEYPPLSEELYDIDAIPFRFETYKREHWWSKDKGVYVVYRLETT